MCCIVLKYFYLCVVKAETHIKSGIKWDGDDKSKAMKLLCLKSHESKKDHQTKTILMKYKKTEL